MQKKDSKHEPSGNVLGDVVMFIVLGTILLTIIYKVVHYIVPRAIDVFLMNGIL